MTRGGQARVLPKRKQQAATSGAAPENKAPGGQEHGRFAAKENGQRTTNYRLRRPADGYVVGVTGDDRSSNRRRNARGLFETGVISKGLYRESVPGDYGLGNRRGDEEEHEQRGVRYAAILSSPGAVEFGCPYEGGKRLISETVSPVVACRSSMMT